MPSRYYSETEARAQLKKLGVKPGSAIYCVLRNVSRSGMTRVIDLFVPHKGDIHRVSHLAAALTHYSMDKSSDGLRVSGCGMDMGFAVVYDLGYKMWPKGTPRPHGTRNGEPDREGGYALKHRWL